MNYEIVVTGGDLPIENHVYHFEGEAADTQAAEFYADLIGRIFLQFVKDGMLDGLEILSEDDNESFQAITYISNNNHNWEYGSVQLNGPLDLE